MFHSYNEIKITNVINTIDISIVLNTHNCLLLSSKDISDGLLYLFISNASLLFPPFRQAFDRPADCFRSGDVLLLTVFLQIFFVRIVQPYADLVRSRIICRSSHLCHLLFSFCFYCILLSDKCQEIITTVSMVAYVFYALRQFGKSRNIPNHQNIRTIETDCDVTHSDTVLCLRTLYVPFHHPAFYTTHPLGLRAV